MNLPNISIKFSTILIIVMAILIAWAVLMTYERIYVSQDYPITANISCDPAVESCFVEECDLEFDPECTEPTYYKVITKQASTMLDCQPAEGDKYCFNTTCVEGEEGCEITYCDPSDEEVTCSELLVDQELEALEVDESIIESEAGEGDQEVVE